MINIVVTEWKPSKSGKSINIFVDGRKFYFPIKKLGLKVGDSLPDFSGAKIELKKDDLWTPEDTDWIRINSFRKIEFNNGDSLSWKESNKIKRSVFGNKKSQKSKKQYKYIDPTDFSDL